MRDQTGYIEVAVEEIDGYCDRVYYVVARPDGMVSRIETFDKDVNHRVVVWPKSVEDVEDPPAVVLSLIEKALRQHETAIPSNSDEESPLSQALTRPCRT